MNNNIENHFKLAQTALFNFDGNISDGEKRVKRDIPEKLKSVYKSNFMKSYLFIKDFIEDLPREDERYHYCFRKYTQLVELANKVNVFD